MKTLLTAFAFLCVMLGCANNDCSTVDSPESPPISFYLVNQSGVPLMGKENPVYAPDSIRLLREGRPLPLSRQFDAELGSYVFETQGYTNNLSGTDLRLLLYLNRNDNDTDTLDITYRIEKGKCADGLTLNTFFFNQVRVFPAGGTRNRLTLKK